MATRCHKDWLQQPWTALQCLCFHSALKESLKESYKLSHPKSLHLCDEAGFVQVSMMPPRKMKVDSQHEQTSTSLCYVIHCYIIVQIHHTIHSMQVQEVRLPNLKFQAHDTNFIPFSQGWLHPLNPSLFSSCFPVYQSKSEFVTLSFLLSVHTRTEVVIKVCKLRFHSLGKRVANECMHAGHCWAASSKTPVNQPVLLDHFLSGGGRHAETHGSSRGWHWWLLFTSDSINGPGLTRQKWCTMGFGRISLLTFGKAKWLFVNFTGTC